MLTQQTVEIALFPMHNAQHTVLRCGEGWATNCEVCRIVIADLLSLTPPPDRKELEKILREAGVWVTEANRTDFMHVADKLMAWATGTEEPRWCAHLLYVPSRELVPQFYFSRRGSEVSEGSNYTMDWTVCPLCAAPRPVRE